MKHIRIGTRGSRLALTQAEIVSEFLRKRGYDIEIIIISTTGDRLADVPVDKIPERGIFVTAIEQALLSGKIDLAVHSLKDLPAGDTPGLVIAAIPIREDPRDVLVGRTAPTIASLSPGAVVGTSSMRRRAELLQMRPDLLIVDMRGNVDTRIRKLDEGQFDAICLAAAGLHRLGLQERITQYFDPTELIPAPGQGALALQTRQESRDIIKILAEIGDPATHIATQIERQVLTSIGGGCSAPIGVHATASPEGYTILAARYSPTGKCLSRLSLKIANGTVEDIVEMVFRELSVL
ncbi:MAG: hydroxymethylbilane synthase [bacterium]